MTHINAYFGEVAEAEAKVAQAQGELEAAQQRLEAKKVEVGLEEPAKESKPQESVTHEVTPPPVDPMPEEVEHVKITVKNTKEAKS